jgi:hypothetical protein
MRIRNLPLIDGVLVAAFWVVALITADTFAFVLAGLWTLRLAFDIARLRARSAGAPQWKANEAYLTLWRRWRRSQHPDA